MSAYDLGPPNESLSITAGAEIPVQPNPALEFRDRLYALTPHVFVTHILIGLNVAAFLAMIVSGVSPMEPTTDNLIRWGANFGPLTIAGGQWWRLLTSMFLHIGIVHIAFNMFVLWQVGPFVERLIGNAGFAIAYLISGFVGALVSLAWNPYVASAGASGAIFGLYGALLGFLALRRDSIPMEVLQPLTKSALIFVGYNLVFGFVRAGTDVACHIGGLVGGFACGLALSIPLAVAYAPRRAMRNAAIAVGGALLCVGGAASLPRPVDIRAELANFGVVEQKTLTAFRLAFSQSSGPQLAEQRADRIEKTVIPDWAAERGRLVRLKGLPERMQTVVSRLVKYMDARQEAWSLLAQGLRKHDMAAIQQSYIKQRQAEDLAKQFSAKPGK